MGMEQGKSSGKIVACGCRTKNRILKGAVFFITFLLLSPAWGAAGQDEFDPKSQITITDIEPVISQGLVRISFSDKAYIHELDDILKVFPDPRVNWRSSSTESSDRTLLLKANFAAGQTYVISLPEDTKLGGRKYHRTLSTFTMPDYPPQITLAENKLVIERDSRQMIHLKFRNVDELLLESIKVPPLLLPMAMSASRQSGFPNMTRDMLRVSVSEAEQLVSGDRKYKPFLGAPVVERQLFFTGAVKNKTEPYSVPLSFRKESGKGAIELLRFSDNVMGDNTSTAVTMVRITDLGLTYKMSDDAILLWVTSLSKGLPVPDATILVFDKDVGAYPVGRTDSDGIFVLEPGEFEGISLKTSEKFARTTASLDIDDVGFLMAATEDDVSYIEVQPSGNIKPERITQVRGSRGGGVQLLKGHVFTERGIYRPGEIVHYKGTVREFLDGKIQPPDEGDVTFTIVNSKKEKVLDRTMPLSEFGTSSGDFLVKPFYPLGTYTLTMKYGTSDKEKVARSFQVQEFRPPRHFTDISFKRVVMPDPAYVNIKKDRDVLQIDISGQYYAGGPVKHGKVRWKIYLSKTDHSVEGFEQYRFGDPMSGKGDLLETGESMLDEKGRIGIEFPVDRDVANGVNGLLVVATVLDFDGRVATEQQVYQARPDFLVGIGVHSDDIRVDEEQSLDLVVVDRKGKPVKKGTLTAELMSWVNTYIRKRNEQGNMYWDWQQVWQKTMAADVAIDNGKVAFDFTVGRYGKFRLRFTYRDKEGNRYSSSTYYEIDYDYRWDQSRRQKRDYDPLPLRSDRTTYRPGDEATISLGATRPVSRYLLTLEQDGILEYRIIRPKPRQRSIVVPIRDSHAPNVYVSVLALMPRGIFPSYKGKFDDEAPSFLFGTMNLSVSKGSADMKVGISETTAKLKGRPGEKVSIDLAARDDEGRGLVAELAVGVVDERVLALTRYETPSLNVLNRFTGPLGVFTGELRKHLLQQTPYDLVQLDELTGGGGLAKDPEAASTRIRKDFNPVAYFNPSVITDENGKASVSFILPDSMTTYRIYVVACDRENRFASAQRALLAVQEFFLEPGLPRFFTMGDKFRFNVSAFNKSEDSGALRFTLETTEGLDLDAAKPNYNVESMDSVKIPVSGEAVKPGDAVVTFNGQMGDLGDAVQLTIPVNSGYVLGTEVLQGSFNGRADVRFPLPQQVLQTPWDEVGTGEVEAVLTVSGSPFLRMSKGLRYLLRYPYGCVEQTSSSVMPLAALRGLINDNMIPDISIEETDKFLEKGVERLLTMQTRSGGFGYWPGYREPHPWGTIYAMSALSVAKASGFDVPKDSLDKAAEYLRGEIRKGEHGATWDAFGAYILALNGNLDDQTLGIAKAMHRDPSREAKLLINLAALTAGKGDRSITVSAIRDQLGSDWAKNRTVAFYARYRAPAIALLAGTAAIPGDPVTETAARRLMGGIDSRGIWTSTSDTGWSLYALGKYFQGVSFAEGTTTVTIAQGGKPIDTVDLEAGEYRTVGFDAAAFLKDPTFGIDTGTDRKFFYNMEFTSPRVDYAKDGYSNGFQVSKVIENSDGSKTFGVGDVVRIKVNISSQRSYWDYRRWEYIVVDDPLPAGFVAINSAIKTEEPVGEENEDSYRSRYWTSDGTWKFAPNFFEIRDDRVLAFRDSMWGGRYQYEYYARAVTEGEFVLPSTKVQLMYSPEVCGYTARDTVTILGR